MRRIYVTGEQALKAQIDAFGVDLFHLSIQSFDASAMSAVDTRLHVRRGIGVPEKIKQSHAAVCPWSND
jgi:hypothetical protein